MRYTLTLALFLCLSSVVGAQTEEPRPLTAEAALRAAKLLEEFDPNSYSLSLTVEDGRGGVTSTRLGKAVGLGSLRQTEVERDFAAVAVAGTNVNNNIFKVAGTNVNNNIFRVASTNVNNNIFKVAGTNVNNNIFKVASTNVNNNIFVSDKQAAAARELNAILETSFAEEAPGSVPMRMRPLSPEHAVRVGRLLQEFDPNSYSLDVEFSGASGEVKKERFGKAVGLRTLTQTSLERDFAAAAVAGTNVNNNIFKVAGTNVNNNIFRVASTNVNNNIFKVASTNVNNNIFKVASTNVNNNIFVSDEQAAAARELNEILRQAAQNR